MKSWLLLLIFVSATLLPQQMLFAQSRPVAPDEYIQSSSRLSTGGVITGRTVQGTSRQQVVSIARLPEQPSSDSRGGSSLRPDASQQTVQRPVQSAAYPYPAATSSRSARLTPNQSISAANQLNPARATFRPTSLQVPNSNSGFRVAQNCDCGPGFQSPGTTVPAVSQPSFVQVSPQPVPQGQLFVPGTSIGGQQIATPQQPATFGSSFNSWWQPIYTGTGIYQPIVGRRRPMPAGTYLGQGIIGQPTAYVHNQPFRNVLRYIAP